MKKAYSLLMLVLAAMLGLRASAASITLTIEVNDPELAKVQYYYYPGGSDIMDDGQLLTFDDDNKAVMEFPDGVMMQSIYVTPVTPAGEDKTYFRRYAIFDSEDQLIDSKTMNAENRKYVNIPVAADGGTLKLDMGPLDDGTVHFTIVGDPAAVSANFYGRRVTGLKEGEQDLTFSPSESYLFIKPVGQPLFYEVTCNGNVVNPSADSAEGAEITYGYLINPVQDGDNVVVTVDFPEGEWPVKINVTDGCFDFITSVTVDGIEAEGWYLDDFAVKAGSTLHVQGDPYNFLVKGFSINGEAKEPTTSISLVVADATTLDFDVEAILREDSFVFYCGDKISASLRSNNGSSYKVLNPGYNRRIEFNNDDNPFTLYVDVLSTNENDQRYIYINNELFGGNEAHYDIVVAPNDVVKAYVGRQAPAFCNVSVTVDGIDMPVFTTDYVAQAEGPAFQVLPGTIVSLEASPAIKSVVVNGKPITHDGLNYSFYADADCQVLISGEALSQKVVTVNVNEPLGVAVVYGAGEYSISLQAGENKVNLGEYSVDEDMLQFFAATGYQITAISCNGIDAMGTECDWGEGRYVFMEPKAGDVFDITAEALVRNQTLVLYGSGIDKTYGTYLADFTGMTEVGTVVNGYSEAKFATSDAPLLFGVYGYFDSADQAYVYLNDEEVEFYFGWDIYAADGDVMKVYVASAAPERYTVSIDCDGFKADPLIYSDLINIVEGESLQVLPGTSIRVVGSDVPEDEILSVTVNGAAVEAGEDGAYEFFVEANSEVVVACVSTGIASIDADRAADGRIYNLQGVRVADNADASRLPAGIYIMGGKKVTIK